MANIPIYIPTYINSAEYTPVNVQPRLLFYNGMIDCEKYYIESASAFGGISREQNAFPYFDNYNVVTGSFPTTDSNSLLFFNEEAVYGEKPNESLYSEYWEKYVELIYNPRTKLLNASAIIPLSDYFDMELNDIIEFRSNYYHLRAINDYNLKNGECSIQLLGPILDDSLIIPRVYYERCMGYSIDNCNNSCDDYYNNCAQFLYEYCLGYSTFNCIEACDDFGNCPTTTTTTTAPPNCDYGPFEVLCNDVTTTSTTTSTTTTTTAAPTTTTTSTSTTSTSTTTSTTTTTSPIQHVRIDVSSLPVGVVQASQYGYVPSGSTRSVGGALSRLTGSQQSIDLYCVTGTFVAAPGTSYTINTPQFGGKICSGWQAAGTGSISYLDCRDGYRGPISFNSVFCGHLESPGGIDVNGTGSFTGSFYPSGTWAPEKTYNATNPWTGGTTITVPNPTPVPTSCQLSGSNPPDESQVDQPLFIYVKNAGQPLQNMWVYPGTYFSLGAFTIPYNIITGSISYWSRVENPRPDKSHALGGTITTQGPFVTNMYLVTHTFTGSATSQPYTIQNCFTYINPNRNL